MTEQEREIIRLMSELRQEEARHQTALIEHLSEVIEIGYRQQREAIETVRKMQDAQNRMLKAIADLFALQHD